MKLTQEAKFLSTNCLHISKKELRNNIIGLFEDRVETYLLNILQTNEMVHEMISEEPKVQKKINFSGPKKKSPFNVLPFP